MIIIFIIIGLIIINVIGLCTIILTTDKSNNNIRKLVVGLNLLADRIKELEDKIEVLEERLNSVNSDL